MSGLPPTEDAFGAALADHHAGRPGPELTLVVDDGFETPAMPPAAFFLPPPAWSPEERDLLALASSGPVLDLGAGAGRHSLWFQDRGEEVTAVDVSPGAVAVCRARGVLDARVHDLADPPAGRSWATVLLLCGNLGLAGGWDETRALLARLAGLCAPGALLLADSVDPTVLTDDHSRTHRARNEAAGRHPGQTRLRLRYGEIETPWWDLLNLRVADVATVAERTGWAVEHHHVAGPDHYVAFRLAQRSARVGTVDQVVDELDDGLDQVVDGVLSPVGVGRGETGPDRGVPDVVALTHGSDRKAGVRRRRP